MSGIRHYDPKAEPMTLCTTCGDRLETARDWSLHRRRHLLEHFASTKDGRLTLELMRGLGKVDQPDPWLLRK